ncbi:hypothetical protein LshimejAT787_0310650 [Lyophyllum shimeji]|uniref:Uncharacterized protein n=1 Tax=Lyophyllum shimeji TaxID=47721 RepID=A0A9P3PIW3_LYOSH|nr:hypothetical protein LshimejAT787_0310650 [Lyophyllum shimeji]
MNLACGISGLAKTFLNEINVELAKIGRVLQAQYAYVSLTWLALDAMCGDCQLTEHNNKKEMTSVPEVPEIDVHREKDRHTLPNPVLPLDIRPAGSHRPYPPPHGSHLLPGAETVSEPGRDALAENVRGSSRSEEAAPIDAQSFNPAPRMQSGLGCFKSTNWRGAKGAGIEYRLLDKLTRAMLDSEVGGELHKLVGLQPSDLGCLPAGRGSADQSSRLNRTLGW